MEKMPPGTILMVKCHLTECFLGPIRAAWTWLDVDDRDFVQPVLLVRGIMFLIHPYAYKNRSSTESYTGEKHNSKLESLS